ncbi:unnamed protein product [Echinostoma caproni]|uniref:Transposase n=1 Tax=Echinostoma caproni TaxID=27848 RepID=A0A183AXI2_9TREM|nr:unnamed protein product [Echinostoma caproni]
MGTPQGTEEPLRSSVRKPAATSTPTMAEPGHRDWGTSQAGVGTQIEEVTIKAGNDETTLVGLYRSPSAETWEDDQLLAFLDEVTGKGHKLLTAGDFDALEVDWDIQMAPETHSGIS